MAEANSLGKGALVFHLPQVRSAAPAQLAMPCARRGGGACCRGPRSRPSGALQALALRPAGCCPRPCPQVALDRQLADADAGKPAAAALRLELLRLAGLYVLESLEEGGWLLGVCRGMLLCSCSACACVRMPSLPWWGTQACPRFPWPQMWRPRCSGCRPAACRARGSAPSRRQPRRRGAPARRRVTWRPPAQPARLWLPSCTSAWLRSRAAQMSSCRRWLLAWPTLLQVSVPAGVPAMARHACLPPGPFSSRVNHPPTPHAVLAALRRGLASAALLELPAGGAWMQASHAVLLRGSLHSAGSGPQQPLQTLADRALAPAVLPWLPGGGAAEQGWAWQAGGGGAWLLVCPDNT